MTIRYQPRDILKKTMKKKDLKNLLSKNLSLNKEALRIVTRSGVISKKEVETVALKVIKGYKKRYKEEIKNGAIAKDAFKDAVEGGKQLINRVENAAVYEMSQMIQEKYAGEYYKWLPSDADEPDPEHQLKYGETFQIGVGEMPGDRYGCKCGMEILVKETTLNL